MTPIFQTSTYVQPALGENTGYEYARLQNPTREALERNLASLEGAKHGITYSSGLAALECLVKTLSAGDHVVSEENTYGGTTRMFTKVLARLGIEFSLVDTRNLDEVRSALRPTTRLIHLETPSNPLMRITDIGAVAKISKEAGTILSVDNTFASPYNQNPLAMGADVVMHSTTKYVNGHSDVLAGALMLDDDALADELHFVRKSTGPVPGPMDSWLILRGTKTLHLRMERHNANGLAIAEFLEGHPNVGRVFFPGLASHPQHDLAKTQMRGFSGMVSAELEQDVAKRLVERTEIFRLAESLGGVESMISIPALMTHASVPADRRAAMGITDGLVRFSTGVEDAADLVADLEKGLSS